MLKILAESLPMLREKLRLTQEDLTDIVGVSRQTITMINKCIGWEPTVSLETGLVKTIDYFKSIPLDEMRG